MKGLVLAFAMLTGISGYSQSMIKHVFTKSGLTTDVAIEKLSGQSTLGNSLTMTANLLNPETFQPHFESNALNSAQGSVTVYWESDKEILLKKLRKKKKKIEKSDEEFMIEGAKWLLESSYIIEDEYELLRETIHNFYNSTSTKEAKKYTSDLYNPLIVDDYYLSAVEIEVKNSDNSWQSISNNFVLEQNNRHIDRLTINSLVQLNSKKSSATAILTNIERFICPNILYIPPHSSLKCIIPYTPLNFNDKKQSVRLLHPEYQFEQKWTVEKHVDVLRESVSYYEIEYELGTIFTQENTVFLAIPIDEATYFQSGESLFIRTDDVDSRFKFIALSISSYSSDIYFGIGEQNLSTLLDFDKLKRDDIILQPNKIKELQKVVK